MKEPDLNRRQQLFCEEYVIDLNATKAAVKAGYSEKTAYSQGHELLKKPEIKEYIASLIDLRREVTRVTQERVLREFARLAFGDRRKTASWGWLGLDLKNSDDLTEDEAAMISEIREKRGPNGVSIEVKYYDKIKALEALGKYLGMFVEKSEITAIIGNVEPSERDRAALRHFMEHYGDRKPPATEEKEEGNEDDYDDLV